MRPAPSPTTGLPRRPPARRCVPARRRSARRPPSSSPPRRGRNLDDLVACVACRAEFAVDCADRAALAAFTTYPAECNPPRPAYSAGVTYETTLDCPTGYTCADNGGGTRYCTQDSDCVDPFGFVCVNPGFGFGVCIGTEPCQ